MREVDTYVRTNGGKGGFLAFSLFFYELADGNVGRIMNGFKMGLLWLSMYEGERRSGQVEPVRRWRGRDGRGNF